MSRHDCVNETWIEMDTHPSSHPVRGVSECPKCRLSEQREREREGTGFLKQFISTFSTPYSVSLPKSQHLSCTLSTDNTAGTMPYVSNKAIIKNGLSRLQDTLRQGIKRTEQCESRGTQRLSRTTRMTGHRISLF